MSNIVEVKDLVKRYGDQVAVNGVSFAIRRGEIIGLLGPNGAGKTTTILMLACLLAPTSGSATICGLDLAKQSGEIKKRIGLVPQDLALYPTLSARDNLLFFGRVYGLGGKALNARVDWALELVGLTERAKDAIKTYSGGMKRRINLAAGLLHQPEILFLDEPTVGVDPQSRNYIFENVERLNREGLTILYTTHYMEEAERLCSRIAIIDHGKIIASGSLDELLTLLPYEQTIIISKNQLTEHKKDLFGKFGTLLNDQEKYELKPKEKLKLSDFFKSMEENGIGYNFIDVNKPSLEALFLHLTGRRLRD